MTAPTPTPSAPPRTTPPTIVLTGEVIDAITLAPIAGAAVSINGRYATVTDSQGNYTVTGLLDAGTNYDYTYVAANNYFSDYRYIRSTPHNIRLYRVERITGRQIQTRHRSRMNTLCVTTCKTRPGWVRTCARKRAGRCIHRWHHNDIRLFDANGNASASRSGNHRCPTLLSERLGESNVPPGESWHRSCCASVEIPFGSAVSQTFTLTTLMTGRSKHKSRWPKVTPHPRRDCCDVQPAHHLPIDLICVRFEFGDTVGPSRQKGDCTKSLWLRSPTGRAGPFHLIYSRERRVKEIIGRVGRFDDRVCISFDTLKPAREGRAARSQAGPDDIANSIKSVDLRADGGVKRYQLTGKLDRPPHHPRADWQV